MLPFLIIHIWMLIDCGHPKHYKSRGLNVTDHFSIKFYEKVDNENLTQ